MAPRPLNLWEKGDFDVILMDIQMPRMDGFEATRRIRAGAKGSHVPIIAMTAFASASDRDRCLAAGMSDFLTKPIDLKEMVSTLSRWIGAEKTPAPQLPSEWPAKLPGIELERGLGHLGNNAALYRKLLVKFRKEEARTAQLDEALASDDRNQALIVVHTLKSVSASLGATELSELCKALEALFREPRGGPREDELVVEFKNELVRVVRGIEAAFVDETPAAAAAGSAAELVRRIGELIEQNFPEALALQRQLTASIGPGSPAADAVGRLKDAMELYQIKAAQDELTALTGMLKGAS